MGFLSWLFGSNRGKGKGRSQACTTESRPIPSPRRPVREEINIDGNCQTKIFTYLGVVFKGIKTGDEFYVDVVDHDMELHSRSTGTTIDTAEWGTTAVSYNGRVFGSLGSGLDYLKEVVAAGFRLRLKVKKVGMYSAGIPELAAMTIDTRALREWWDQQSKTSALIPINEANLLAAVDERREANRLRTISGRAGIEVTDESLMATLYPTRERWLGGDWPKRSAYFSPTFEVLPTREGSQAKPHILIRNGETGLYEVSARNAKAYQTISENINRPCKGRIACDYYDEGTDGVRIILVFESSVGKAEGTAELFHQASGEADEGGGLGDGTPGSPT